MAPALSKLASPLAVTIASSTNVPALPPALGPCRSIDPFDAKVPITVGDSSSSSVKLPIEAKPASVPTRLPLATVKAASPPVVDPVSEEAISWPPASSAMVPATRVAVPDCAASVPAKSSAPPDVSDRLVPARTEPPVWSIAPAMSKLMLSSAVTVPFRVSWPALPWPLGP